MNDLVFKCYKCGHLVFIDKHKVLKLLDYECPSCGEEPTWILEREGDYEEEYGD